MQTVGELLDSKGHEVFSIHPDATVFEAVQSMAERGVGSLLVMQDSRMVGILSERDYARKCILQNRSSRETPVRDIMTTDVVCAQPFRSIEECMALMTEKRIRHLPVADGDRVLGLVSLGDLVKSLVVKQQFIIEQLEHYIAG